LTKVTGQPRSMVEALQFPSNAACDDFESVGARARGNEKCLPRLGITHRGQEPILPSMNTALQDLSYLRQDIIPDAPVDPVDGNE